MISETVKRVRQILQILERCSRFANAEFTVLQLAIVVEKNIGLVELSSDSTLYQRVASRQGDSSAPLTVSEFMTKVKV